MPQTEARARDEQVKPMNQLILTTGITLMALLRAGCGGANYGALQPSPEDLCKCLPIEPDIADFRHLGEFGSSVG